MLTEIILNSILQWLLPKVKMFFPWKTVIFVTCDFLKIIVIKWNVILQTKTWAIFFPIFSLHHEEDISKEAMKRLWGNVYMLNIGNLKFISPCISVKPAFTLKIIFTQCQKLSLFKNITMLQGPLFSVKIYGICQAWSLKCEYI